METIAVVDDDSQFRTITKMVLGSAQKNVLSFENGLSAWTHLDTLNSVDIVLSDINMPGMSGLELLSKIKNKYPEKICIMMSGDPRNEKDAKDLGADAFINKPFRANEIANLLETFE